MAGYTSIVPVPFEEYGKLVRDSSDKDCIKKILETEFPDEACQLVAIKSVLGVVEETEEEENPSDSSDTDDSSTSSGDTTSDTTPDATQSATGTP